jgi:hypothetical protein
MSKFDEKVQIYVDAVKELKLDISTELLTGVAKSLGPSIYLGDASLVSGSDKSELDRVKNNFCIKKLGLSDSKEVDDAIKSAVEAMGTSNRSKHRAIVYALIAKHFKKESLFS